MSCRLRMPGVWGKVWGTGAYLTGRRLTHNTGTHHPWQNGDAITPKGSMQPVAGPRPQEGDRHCLRGADACSGGRERPDCRSGL